MIGIICALSIEVAGLEKLLQNKEEHTYAKMRFVSGTIGGKEVVLTECGIGKVNAAMSAQVMIDHYSPTVIINSGIAGSVSRQLKIGDIVISKDCVQHDFDGTQMGDPKGLIQYNDETRIDIPADMDTANKLYNACKDIENTNVLLGRMLQATFSLLKKLCARVSLTNFLLLRARWRAVLSLRYATETRCHLRSYDVSPMTLTKISSWTLWNLECSLLTSQWRLSRIFWSSCDFSTSTNDSLTTLPCA